MRQGRVVELDSCLALGEPLGVTHGLALADAVPRDGAS